MSDLRNAEWLTPDGLRRLRRIAREAQNTYVGRHWPSMEDMRRDGIGHGLVEDRAHERFIRRFLDTFQPEFVVSLLDAVAALRATDVPSCRVHVHVKGDNGDACAACGHDLRELCHERATDVPSWREASRRLHASGDDEPYV